MFEGKIVHFRAKNGDIENPYINLVQKSFQNSGVSVSIRKTAQNKNGVDAYFACNIAFTAIFNTKLTEGLSLTFEKNLKNFDGLKLGEKCF